MSNIPVTGPTGKPPVSRRHSCPGFNRPVSLAKLHTVSNAPVNITRSGPGPTGSIGAIQRDSGRKLNVKKPSDVAPVNAASLAGTSSPSTPVPVQSGKTTRFDVLILKAQRACANLDEELSAWLKQPSGDYQDELAQRVHYALHELKRTSKALTHSPLKRWFSPKHRLAAAELQNTLNAVEVKIINKLTEDKLECISLADTFKKRIKPGVSTEEIRHSLADATPFGRLATLLTPAWCAACPGVAALAKKAARVQKGLVEIGVLRRDDSGLTAQGYLKERRIKMTLLQQIDAGVPRHLRHFVAKRMTRFVAEF